MQQHQPLTALPIRGQLIAVEGIDGTGKTTLASALLRHFHAHSIPCISTRCLNFLESTCVYRFTLYAPGI